MKIRIDPQARSRENSVVRIQASRGFRVDLRELWSYKELLYFFVWRDVKVRYKQTAFGAGWAVFQPLLLMLVFAIFLGRLVKVPSQGIPYPMFVYTALVLWTFLSLSLSMAADSLVKQSHLISKVYFPRLLLPLAAVGSYLVDFLVALVLLLGMMVFYDVYPTASVFWLPGFVLIGTVVVLGLGIWLAALNVRYRDVRYVVPFLLQVWFFASPIVYPSTLVSSAAGGTWKTLYDLNPMVGVMDGFRWTLLGTPPPSTAAIVAAAAISLVGFIAAVAYFNRVEREFADVI